jgi:hypothetical protein
MAEGAKSVTRAEAIVAIQGIVTTYRNRPQEFLSGKVVMVVRRPGYSPRGERMRVLPNVMGRVVCVNAVGEIVVDVEVADLERWLANETRTPTTGTEG